MKNKPVNQLFKNIYTKNQLSISRFYFIRPGHCTHCNNTRQIVASFNGSLMDCPYCVLEQIDAFIAELKKLNHPLFI